MPTGKNWCNIGPLNTEHTILRKALVTTACVLLVLVTGGYLFRDALIDGIKDSLTSDMFIAADTDAFDAGLAVGDTFPPIRALYQGQEISDVGRFIPDKGMVFIANRSADW